MKTSALRSTITTLAILLAAGLLLASPAFANHTVQVEGDSDFDGDGRLGTDEDLDGDLVFGTLNAALQDTAGSISQNGRITIVTSGKFLEGLTITAGGNVIIEAAPGVSANLEAFNPPGDAPGNTGRQNAPGITVDSDGSFIVVLRNLTIRNWTTGILVKGSSRVTVDGCLLDSNVSYGIRARENARITVVNSRVDASGFRKTPSPGVDNTPSPGIGIAFDDNVVGAIASTTVSHSFAAGLANRTPDRIRMRMNDVTVFDNRPDYHNAVPRLFDRLTFTP